MLRHEFVLAFCCLFFRLNMCVVCSCVRIAVGVYVHVGAACFCVRFLDVLWLMGYNFTGVWIDGILAHIKNRGVDDEAMNETLVSCRFLFSVSGLESN